jgi:hypothetical protein
MSLASSVYLQVVARPSWSGRIRVRAPTEGPHQVLEFCHRLSAPLESDVRRDRVVRNPLPFQSMSPDITETLVMIPTRKTDDAIVINTRTVSSRMSARKDAQ